MNIKFRTKAKGFSLIEVMIALVILAVGILGISKLQGVLIKNSSNANQRAVAVSIAQKKIDDLKSFVYLTTVPIVVPNAWTISASGASEHEASVIAYSHIADDEGGAPIGSTDLLAGALTVGNYNYTLNWDVTDYWFDPATLAAASTVDPSGGAAAHSDQKLVTIIVKWDDEVGAEQVVTLSTIIDAYAPVLTAFSDNPSNLGGDGPVVSYTPLAAPDVVPVTLDVGGQKKESSKPVPDLSKKGDSTVVKFQTVSYSPIALSSVTATERREEFLTAVCNCKSAGTTPTTSIEKGSLEWDAEDLVLRDVALTVSVTSGDHTLSNVDNGGGEDQHVSCTACCRDGTDVSGTTFKTCRMKRVDGIFRLFEPWKMIAFNIIPASYFNTATSTVYNSLPTMTSTIQASNIALYSDYVKSVVRNALTIIKATSDVPSTVDTSFNSYSSVNNFNNGASTIHTQFTAGEANYRELQARAIYLDIPPNEIYDGGSYTPTGVSAVPLDRVPFYENNFTQIAGWIPDVNEGENTSLDGDLTWASDYTTVHDYMDNSCENPNHNTPAERTALNRNHVTNEKFFYSGGGATITCLNASRGAFYPIITTVSGVLPSDPATGVVTSRMFTSNDGVIDRLVNTGASSVDATVTLTVIP